MYSMHMNTTSTEVRFPLHFFAHVYIFLHQCPPSLALFLLNRFIGIWYWHCLRSATISLYTLQLQSRYSDFDIQQLGLSKTSRMSTCAFIFFCSSLFYSLCHTERLAATRMEGNDCVTFDLSNEPAYESSKNRPFFTPLYF